MAKTQTQSPNQIRHADESAKLASLEQQFAERQAECREAIQAQGNRRGDSGIDAAATAILAGGAAVATKSLKVLTFEKEALEQAVSRQQSIVESARRQVAREVAVELVDEHRRIVASVAEAGQQFLEAHSKIAAFRAKFAGLTGDAFQHPLMELDLNQQAITRFKNDLSVFAQFVSEYSGR